MRKKTELREAQDKTITILYEEDCVLAILPMGAGKTAAGLTAIAELIANRHIECALVLAPKNVAELVWPAEICEWEHLHHLMVQVVSGTPVQREHKLLHTHADVYVVGIDNTQWLCGVLEKLPKDHKLFDLLCIDEISRFKSPKGKRAKALAKLAGRWKQRWGMTGTPRPNGLEDLFMPVRILSDGRVWGKSFYQWRQRNFFPTDWQQYNWAPLPGAKERLQEQIDAISVTVSGMPDMPPYQPVFHWLDMPEEAWTMYRDMEKQLVSIHWDDDKETWIDAANKAVATGKLSQLAQGFMYHGEEREPKWVHTVKADYLQDMLEGLDENVLVSYEFQEDLAELLRRYPKTPYLGAGVKPRAVKENERRWNLQELPRMFLHPASAGHGLNLQHGGHQFIWYAMTWSAELYDQTLKRIHRPGQTMPCFGHHILMRDTIDEIKYDRVINKMTEQEAFRNYLKRRV